MTKEIKCHKCNNKLTKAETVHEFEGETKEAFTGVLWGYRCPHCGALIKKERVR